MRLIWPVHGERRSYQSGGLQDAKRIAVAFASVGQDAKKIAVAFAFVGHAAVLPVHFFSPLFNLPRCSTTPRLPVSYGAVRLPAGLTRSFAIMAA